MGKRYTSVSEMVRQLSEDREFQDNLDRQISDKTLAKTMFAMRCSRGMTQSEMASKLHCTQSRVSKLENSGVDAIKVSDLIDYAQALGLKLSISFKQSVDKLPKENVQKGTVFEVCGPSEIPDDDVLLRT